MAVKMNSTDERFRDKRDIPLLLDLAQRTIDAWVLTDLGASKPWDYQGELNELRDRRAAEDAGTQLP